VAACDGSCSHHAEWWGLSADEPLVAPSHAAKRGELARAFELGVKR